MDSDEQRQARDRYPIKLAIRSALRLVASLARSASVLAFRSFPAPFCYASAA